MIIKSVMSKDPICISADASLTDAMALMTKHKISKLPVIDKNKDLVGIITKNDLSKASPSDATTLDMFEISYLLTKINVSKIMTKNVISVREDEVVEECARIMVDNQIGCIPIVKDKILIGIVTESDLFHLFTDMFGARQSGVRATLEMQDKPGSIASLAKEIAEINGNIISLVTRDCSDKENRKLTVKVTDVSLVQFQEIAKKLGITIEDIRVV